MNGKDEDGNITQINSGLVDIQILGQMPCSLKTAVDGIEGKTGEVKLFHISKVKLLMVRSETPDWNLEPCLPQRNESLFDRTVGHSWRIVKDVSDVQQTGKKDGVPGDNFLARFYPFLMLFCWWANG